MSTDEYLKCLQVTKGSQKKLKLLWQRSIINRAPHLALQHFCSIFCGNLVATQVFLVSQNVYKYTFAPKTLPKEICETSNKYKLQVHFSQFNQACYPFTTIY